MFDIIIDDGGHTMAQQKTTIEHLFRKVKDGGIYLVEDTHTSYWHEFHGGYKNKNSFIEYSKNFIDALHEWHVHDGPAIPSNDIMRNVNCISFYDSIVVFEKGERKKPFTVQRGHKTITPYVDPTLQKLSLAKQIQKKFYQLTRKKEA
jgi:hypothetical protein